MRIVDDTVSQPRRVVRHAVPVPAPVPAAPIPVAHVAPPPPPKPARARRPAGKIERVLFLDAPWIDFSAEMTRHGLVEVLGRERVVTLNPHPGNLPWTAWFSELPTCTEDEAAEQIASFDLVVLASCHAQNGATLERLLARVGRDAVKHLVIVDGSDADWLPPELARFEPDTLAKRELLPGTARTIDGTRVESIPFAAPYEDLPSPAAETRDLDVVFLGGRNHLQGAYKPPFLRAVQGVTSSVVHEIEGDNYEPYLAALRRARIAISIRGYGWETTRTMEILASGAMLVAERSPLVYLHPFVDGEHCALYSTPQELADVVRRYLADEPTRARVAEAGQAWMRAHHTTKARARELLAAAEAP